MRKMSGATAALIGLSDPDRHKVPRGLIRFGFAADLVVFEPAQVQDRGGM